MFRKTLGLCALAVAGGSWAADYEISNRGTLDTKEASTRILAESLKVNVEYPVSVGMPIFWLDASKSSNWTFEDAAAGTVKTVPSVYGERYATVNEADLVTWKGWSNGASKPQPPILRPAGYDSAIVGPYLDFGAAGSRRSLVFNAYEYVNGAATNELRNIGSVVAVIGSREGGGWGPLGGGEATATGSTSAAYKWHRGLASKYSYQEYEKWYYDNTLGNIGHWYENIRAGGVRFDGMAAGFKLGFNHTWQTLVFPGSSGNGTAVATGISVGDTRSNHSPSSGGNCIAELLVYDHELTEAECVQLEMYLDNKWFGRTRDGYNGNACLGQIVERGNGATENGAVLTVEVAAGDRLHVGQVVGGHAIGPELVKTGEGELAFGDITGYSATLRLKGGSVSFEKRAIPATTNDLPADLLHHFDASNLEALTTEIVEGEEKVSYWKNENAAAVCCGKKVNLHQPTQTRQPKLLRNRLGSGKNAVDFGLRSNSGAFMGLSTNALATGAIKYAGSDSMATVVAVVEAYNGGPYSLLDGSTYRRGSDSTRAKAATLLQNSDLKSDYCYVNAKNGSVWTDGIKRDPLIDGYASYGFQTVAFKVPLAEVSNRVGCRGDSNYAGGFALAELMVWNRTLSDREIEDVQAYLSQKWFARETPGYAKPEAREEVPDIQCLVVDTASVIDVAEGTTVRVREATLNAALMKTGAGTLKIETLKCNGVGSVTISGGNVECVELPTVKDDAALAASPALHLDAEDTERMEYYEYKGTNLVWRWLSEDGLSGVINDRGLRLPFYNAERKINGHPTVDFRQYGSKACCTRVMRPLYSARAVYAVVEVLGGGFLLGTDTTANYDVSDPEMYDMHPKLDANNNPTAFLSGFAGSSQLMQGEILTNGVSFKYTEALTNGVMLLELHPVGGVSASWLCSDRGNSRYGGYAIAELVIYDRPLTEREKVSTRNYLMAKYFNKSKETLPKNPSVSTLPERYVTVNGELERAFDADKAIRYLDGKGEFVKTGYGTLTLWDAGSFTGTLSVAAGTVRIDGADSAAEPKLCKDGLTYWADANYGVDWAVTNGDGNVLVRNWKSRLDNGWSARPYYDSSSGAYSPVQVPNTPALDYNSYMSLEDGSYKGMCFYKDGVITRLDGIRSILWVIGSQRGGGFLMGGGQKSGVEGNYAWHRGQIQLDNVTYQGSTNYCPMLHGATVCWPETYYADWWRNGEHFYAFKRTLGSDGLPNTPNFLSGNWDVLTMVVTNGADDVVNADGFAYDGRKNNWGNQRLGEVLVYNRRLTDEERLQTESYLSVKWNLNGVHKAAENTVINVAKNASFVAGDTTNVFESVRGEGVIKGSVRLKRLIGDYEQTVPTTVTGAVVLPDEVQVELVNMPSSFFGKLTVQILKAPAIIGDVSSAVITGATLPEGYKMRLMKTSEGVLQVVIRSRGGILITR